MRNLSVNRSVLMLHFTILIWGFTGVLGELISISALPLVWYRVLIASLSLYIFFLFKRQSVLVNRAQLIQFLLVGGLVGLHWVLFFHSIKISTVSVTLVTLSSLTLFTAILEPFINRRKISLADVAVGLVIIFGIYLIFKFEFQYKWGIICGLGCALCASLFSIINAQMVKKSRAAIITFYEMIGAFILVSAMMVVRGDFTVELELNSKDLVYLLILGVACTSFAYVLGVSVMKELSAFTVALTTNLEPIYGIILALLIFGQKEAMSTGFYYGAAIILSAVFLFPIIKTKWQKRKAQLVNRKLH